VSVENPPLFNLSSRHTQRPPKRARVPARPGSRAASNPSASQLARVRALSDGLQRNRRGQRRKKICGRRWVLWHEQVVREKVKNDEIVYLSAPL
jgi:hypothetical protein